MKQPPIKTKELSGSTVQIEDGQNWEIASITAYGENAQGGTTEAPVALTGVDSVHVCGRNLLPLPYSQVSETKNGLNIAVNADGTITVSGTATAETYLNLKPIPASLYRLMGVTGIVPAYDYPVTKNGFTFFDLTIQPHVEFALVYIVITKGSVVNRTYRPYIIKSAEPLPYETYQGSVTPLPIPRPLHKVGDVRDVCRTRVKSVYDKRIVLDGAEKWKIDPTHPDSFILTYFERIVKGLSDSYLSLRLSEVGVKTGIYLTYTLEIIITDPTCSTVEELKAKLAAHPITVYYQSTAYDGTNGLDVCLTEYQTGFVELDGTENWQWNSNTAWPYIATFLPNNNTGVAPVCSHYQGTGAVIPAANQVAINELGSLIIKDPSWKSVDDAKAYLAAQKEAGTPVQVAYQLATPETYATDPVDFDNAAGPLTVMTGGEVEVTLTHRMLTPYTAWTIQYDSEGEYTGDFFNVEDYDRIKQNIEYLREYAYFLYGGFTMRGMVAVTVESYGYASTIDALDANLEAIAANTFRPPDMMPVKQWRGNQPPPGADDWNRIENTCLLLFEQFERQSACLPKLAFELKGSAF